MTSWRDRYKVCIPEGVSRDWRVEHFSVSESQASLDSLRGMLSGSGRSVPEGTYTALYHKRSLVMSDTPDEIRDHLGAVQEAQRRGGHILINGLGLGMVTAAILDAEQRCQSCMQYPHHGKCDCTHVAGEINFRYAVDKVTVIEKSEDVIALIRPILWPRYGNRLEIIHADAFEYKPEKGQRFSIVWNDIWNDLCTDNLKEMGTLHRKYGRRCDWQGSWGKEILQTRRRQERGQC